MPYARPLFAILIIIVSWAVIYLPWLGKRELYGEEARRVLPGRTMLQNGDWALPRSGGDIYNRKPPLVNWMSAAAIKLTGQMNEWTVRTPSTLMMLAMALCIFMLLRGWLGNDAALLAALISITTKAAIDKGRMIEIEALYVSLYGIAMAAWLGLRWQHRDLLAWTVSGLVLGLGFLAKGPPHMLYFYACVIGVLVCEHKLSELRHWHHFAGLACFFVVWVPWSLINSARNVQHDSSKVWVEQITHRLGLSEFNLTNYLLQIPMSLADCLPWALLLPLCWRVDAGSDRHGQWLRGLRYGMVLSFLAIALLPSSRPRFMMPLQMVAGILIAGALAQIAADRFAKIAARWRIGALIFGAAGMLALIVAPLVRDTQAGTWNAWHWLGWFIVLPFAGLALRGIARRETLTQPSGLGTSTAAACGLIMIALAFHFVTRSPWDNGLRNLAAQIESHTGTSAPILLYKLKEGRRGSGERLWPFYLGMRCYETGLIRDCPVEIAFRWIIVPFKLWERSDERAVIEKHYGPTIDTTTLAEPDGSETYVLAHTGGT